ncbi:hypothetical protein CYMTET_41854 [Cymbomonas tetramitiformis]|uniref:Uncharacterized protein n=1 Tax=Cymbomonas tetramitiformis TaxID=36881 RepID=A0AAE0F281_9CHLO|nr:hypothetical protein CYMTET_41854 [Cymbomonas tetramitiformis]
MSSENAETFDSNMEGDRKGVQHSRGVISRRRADMISAAYILGSNHEQRPKANTETAFEQMPPQDLIRKINADSAPERTWFLACTPGSKLKVGSAIFSPLVEDKMAVLRSGLVLWVRNWTKAVLCGDVRTAQAVRQSVG